MYTTDPPPRQADRLAGAIADVAMELDHYGRDIVALSESEHLTVMPACEFLMALESATDIIAAAIARAEDHVRTTEEARSRLHRRPAGASSAPKPAPGSPARNNGSPGANREGANGR
jgi:hypothetical protein